MYKVLVIAYYFPPLGLSGVQRTLKFVKYFKNYDWEPVVLTTGNIAYYAHDESLLKEAIDSEIRIERVSGKDINSKIKPRTVKMPPEFIRKVLGYISKTIFIPDNKNGWAISAYSKACELLSNEQFDAIYVSAPPFSSFNLAVKLKEKFNIPLVADYRDLWFGSQFSFYPTPFHKIIHKKMEYRNLKAADKIIVINRRMKEQLLHSFQFLTFDDIVILSQGYDPADFENAHPEPRANRKMRITYSGIFYEFITPKYFLKAFKKLTIDRPDIAGNIELEFIGLLRKENKRLIKKLHLQEYIKEHGYVSHKQLISKLLSADFLWAMIGKVKNAQTISLGKIYEYIGTRKPILVCAPESDGKNTAEEYKASYITNYNDIKAIKNALINMYNDWKSGNLPVPNEEFIEKHRRDLLSEQLTKQFQYLIKEKVR